MGADIRGFRFELMMHGWVEEYLVDHGKKQKPRCLSEERQIEGPRIHAAAHIIA